MKTKLLSLFTCLYSCLCFPQAIELTTFVENIASPVEITHAGDLRLFVVQQEGTIRIVRVDGSILKEPFLDVSNLITAEGNEQGLLGLAFHPDYQENGLFYINYTNTDGDTVIARYSVSETSEDMADPDSALILLTIEQPFTNHNGGTLKFGPDGYLYIGMGDGGNGGDPGNRAQNMDLLLGKMLRLDVDAEAPYVPAGNPYVGTDGADEIWASGLRNPWKFSFNRLTGDLWIADVGQDAVEEINKVSAETGGLNFGWRCYEGSSEFETGGCGDIGEYTMPFAEYSQTPDRCSVTGGYVYTGEVYPNMQGKYFFADLCSGEIGMVDAEGNITFTDTAVSSVTTFGEDMNGELYMATGGHDGAIYKITDTSMSTDDFAATGFSIYPNPAKNEVFVTMKNAGQASVTLYDMGGKLLVQQQVTPGTSRIDTSALQGGIYVLSIESDEDSRNQKLVINR